MSTLSKRNFRSPLALWAAVALACILQAILVAIIVTLATKKITSDGSVHRVALAASFTEILSIPVAVGAAFLYERRLAPKIRFVLSVAIILLTVPAAILSIYALVRIWENFAGENSFPEPQSLIPAGIAVWSIMIVAQIILVIMLFRPKLTSSDTSSMQELGIGDAPSRLSKRPISAQSTHFAPSNASPAIDPDTQPVSSAFSAYSTSPRSSFQSPLSKVLRPVTSKTKLLLQHSFASQDIASLASSRATPAGTRDSTPDIAIRDGTTSPSIVSDIKPVPKFFKKRLEAIPGSRPLSPATAQSIVHRAFLPEFLPDDEFPLGSPFSLFNSQNSSQITLTRSHSTRHSDAAGGGGGQSHIHPLFRSESPTPPPVASPRTVITASPYGGQIVSPEQHPFGIRRWHSTSEFRGGSLGRPLMRSGSGFV